MQYQKHNFGINFLNAAGTDNIAAWDILVNEINDVVLDNPRAIAEAIRGSGIRLASEKPTAKDMVDIIHDHIYVNKDLRKLMMGMVMARHRDPYINADGGAFDKALIGDKTINASGTKEDEMFSYVVESADKLVDGTNNEKLGAVDQSTTKKMAQDSLAAKEKQRNLPVSRNSGTINVPKVLGISLAVAGAIGLIIYFVSRSNKQNGN